MNIINCLKKHNNLYINLATRTNHLVNRGQSLYRKILRFRENLGNCLKFSGMELIYSIFVLKSQE